jgi:hypothetical protein
MDRFTLRVDVLLKTLKPAGTLSQTSAPGPILTASPISMGPTRTESAPMLTSSPNTGAFRSARRRFE